MKAPKKAEMKLRQEPQNSTDSMMNSGSHYEIKELGDFNIILRIFKEYHHEFLH